MNEPVKSTRRQQLQEYKKQKILEAAGALFREKGLDGTTMRAIATRAGYSTGAPYAYYQSKEEIYADLLSASLARLTQFIKQEVQTQSTPPLRAAAAVSAYFRYYFDHSEDLQLGLYLFSPGEVKKRGFSKETNQQLNSRLLSALGFMANCLNELPNVTPEQAQQETLDATTYITGALMLSTTGRLETIDAQAEEMIDRYIEGMLQRISG